MIRQYLWHGPILKRYVRIATTKSIIGTRDRSDTRGDRTDP